jgi:transcriptional regulator with GAF, ATPase, and Fis domain
VLADDDEVVKALARFQDSSHSSLKRAFSLVTRAAPLRRPVLVCGETGTGKEVVAHAVHAYSSTEDDRRYGRKRPFIAINCANLPSELVDAELFGHVRGAFTGANAARPGLFALADKGTLFLDEIGEMPLGLQAKLLRVLDNYEIRPVGASESQKVDCLVVAATNRDLEREVREGRFREDLFQRLSVVRVTLPPLRDRGPEEILGLADYYVRRNAPPGETRRLSEQARPAILAYSWPGNVRELETKVGLAASLSEQDEISVEDLGLEGGGLRESPAGGLDQIAQDRLTFIHWIIAEQIRDIRAKGKDAERLKGGIYLRALQMVLSVCENDPDRAARTLAVSSQELREDLVRLAQYRGSMKPLGVRASAPLGFAVQPG